MTVGSSLKKVAGLTHGLAEVRGLALGAGKLGILLQSFDFILPANWLKGYIMTWLSAGWIAERSSGLSFMKMRGIVTAKSVVERTMPAMPAGLSP